MACFQQRNGGESVFGESARVQANQLRAFGREIQNIPETRFNSRSQSIKSNVPSGSGTQKINMDLDSNICEQENGAKRSSPRKFSMHVKHTSEVPQNHHKRFSNQIDTSSSTQNTNTLNNNQNINPNVIQNPSNNNINKLDMTQIEVELNRLAKEDSEKPTLVSQYSKQIFDYLRNKEAFFKVSGYMERQMHISERMRSILVDWLVEAHKKFRLLPETLFMTVNIIDRYLELATCTREKLQLVGVTALFISAKYEEIYPPPLKDFVEMTQKAYSKAEILQMEGNIVCALKFNLTVPSSLRFLERYGRVEKLDKKSLDMSQYLLELALVEYKFVKSAESLKSCAAIYLTNKLFKKSLCWSDVIASHSQHTEQQIRACALDLCILLQNASQSSTQAVRKKFLSPNFSEVATIQIEKINNPSAPTQHNHPSFPPNIPKYNH